VFCAHIRYRLVLSHTSGALCFSTPVHVSRFGTNSELPRCGSTTIPTASAVMMSLIAMHSVQFILHFVNQTAQSPNRQSHPHTTLRSDCCRVYCRVFTNHTTFLSTGVYTTPPGSQQHTCTRRDTTHCCVTHARLQLKPAHPRLPPYTSSTPFTPRSYNHVIVYINRASRATGQLCLLGLAPAALADASALWAASLFHILLLQLLEILVHTGNAEL